MTNATSSLHKAPIYVPQPQPQASLAVWSKDTSADGVMDSVNQTLCLYHVLDGECSVPSSVSSLVLWSSLHFVFYNCFLSANSFMINLRVDVGFQTLVDSEFSTSVDSGFQSTGFRIPIFSGFRILYQCRFRIPIH